MLATPGYYATRDRSRSRRSDGWRELAGAFDDPAVVPGLRFASAALDDDGVYDAATLAWCDLG